MSRHFRELTAANIKWAHYRELHLTPLLTNFVPIIRINTLQTRIIFWIINISDYCLYILHSIFCFSFQIRISLRSIDFSSKWELDKFSNEKKNVQHGKHKTCILLYPVLKKKYIKKITGNLFIVFEFFILEFCIIFIDNWNTFSSLLFCISFDEDKKQAKTLTWQIHLLYDFLNSLYIKYCILFIKVTNDGLSKMFV